MTKTRWLSLVLLGLWAPSAFAELPPPEKDEVPLRELKSRVIELDGKVVETEIANVLSYSQVAPGMYRVNVDIHSNSGNGWDSFSGLYFPEEALEYLEKKSRDINHAVRDRWYVRIDKSHKYKYLVVGEKYTKSRKTYKW